MPGPMPKRIEERRRRNAVPGETVVVMVGAVNQPPLPTSPAPHPVAEQWYASLAESGQAEFFEPSDWAAAVYVVEAMTKNLKSRQFSAQLFASVWTAMGELLSTELARRKARLQIQRVIDGTEVEIEKPTAIDEYRKALGG